MEIYKKFNKPTEEKVSKLFQSVIDFIEKSFDVDTVISVCNVNIYYLVNGVVITITKTMDGIMTNVCKKDEIELDCKIEKVGQRISQFIFNKK
jgi:hypothetical protein